MYSRLKDLFDNSNEWLKFAEAKHAGLIALNSGILFGALSIYKDYKDTIAMPVVLVSFTFIVASLVTSFTSLFPRVIKKIKSKKRPKQINLFFAGDLSLFDASELKKELAGNSGHQFDRLEEDLIEQMIVNAIISTKKYHLFKIALVLLIGGLAIPIIMIFAMLIFN